MKKLYTLTFVTVMLAGMNLTAQQVHYYIGAYGTGGPGQCWFDPDTIVVGVNDTVWFTHQAGPNPHSSVSNPTGPTPPSVGTWSCNLNAANDTCGYITFAALGTVTYRCLVHSSIGTGAIIVNAVGIPEVKPGQVSVNYPNPFGNTTEIYFKGTDMDQLQVFDLVGKLVLTKSIPNNANKVVLDMGDLPNGSYFYRLMEEGQVVETKKLVKHN